MSWQLDEQSELRKMVLQNSIKEIRKYIREKPESLLNESVIITAMNYSTEQIVILLLQNGIKVPESCYCFLFPDHRLNLLYATGINIRHIGCRKPHSHPSQKEINQAAFNAVKNRLIEVCMALQDLELDANRLMYILYFVGLPFTNKIPLHIFWNLVTTIKHFHDRRRKQLETFFKRRTRKLKLKI
jgi:hypothetical protein